MKNKIAILVICSLIALALGIHALKGPGTGQHRQTTPDKPYVKANANDLRTTIVTPHMEQAMTPGRNILWCSTFQLAWNELKGLAGGPLRLNPRSQLADVLNRQTASKADLDDASYVAKAGLTSEGILKDIREELRRKFHGRATPHLLDSTDPGDFIAYAYLEKDMPFKYPFRRFHDGLRFQGHTVQSFGIEQYDPSNAMDREMAGQVSVIDCKGRDRDFIAELRTERQGDRLILAEVPPRRALRETILMVEKRVSVSKPRPMFNESYLRVPVLDFDILRGYPELLEHRINARGTKADGRCIGIALQSIRFRLNEKGAKLKSEAEIAGGISFTNLVFDKPFLILLQRKGARNPYFAMWVGNADLLMPSKSTQSR